MSYTFTYIVSSKNNHNLKVKYNINSNIIQLDGIYILN